MQTTRERGRERASFSLIFHLNESKREKKKKKKKNPPHLLSLIFVVVGNNFQIYCLIYKRIFYFFFVNKKGQTKYVSWTYVLNDYRPLVCLSLFDLLSIFLFTRYSHESVNLTIKNQTHVRQVSYF